MRYSQLTSKDICLLVAIVLALELIVFIVLSGSGTAAISAFTSAAFAYFTGKNLRNPSEIPSASQVAISSLPAAALLILGFVILASSTSSWGLWLAITLGFMIGNRAKAAGMGERVSR